MKHDASYILTRGLPIALEAKPAGASHPASIPVFAMPPMAHELFDYGPILPAVS